MLIQELSRVECLNFLAGTNVARLACVHEDQPHIVPVYLTYDGESPGMPSLYGVTTLGDKIEWMRTNPRVCVEVDEITNFDQWVSVVVLGRYEELKAGAEEEQNLHLRSPRPTINEDQEPLPQPSLRLKAFQILQHHAMWWELASTAWASRQHHQPGEPYEPIYYRVNIDQVTGHRALSQTPEAPIAPM